MISTHGRPRRQLAVLALLFAWVAWTLVSPLTTGHPLGVLAHGHIDGADETTQSSASPHDDHSAPSATGLANANQGDHVGETTPDAVGTLALGQAATPDSGPLLVIMAILSITLGWSTDRRRRRTPMAMRDVEEPDRTPVSRKDISRI